MHLSLILMDLDHFKQVNDLYGHSVGDSVLQQFVTLSRQCMPQQVQLFRVGGEEFAILLLEEQRNEAASVADQLRCLVAETDIEITPDAEQRPLRITLSLGVSGLSADIQTVFRRCDQALYQAKNGGRNQVIVVDTPASSDSI